MKTFEELKAEAIARGIKPGAVVQDYQRDIWTVPSWDKATYTEDGCLFFKNLPCRNGDIYTNHGCVYSYSGTWATVITPAPEDQQQGLEDGMACEPDEHMRRAIVDKAKELGIHGDAGRYGGAPGVQMLNGVVDCILPKVECPSPRTWITPGEFYDRLCKTVKPDPPIRIGGHEVKFNTGSIQVGCTTVPNDIVQQIAERLKD